MLCNACPYKISFVEDQSIFPLVRTNALKRIPAKCHACRHRKLRSHAYSRLVKMLELLQHELSRFEKCFNYLKKLEPL